jgi:hypothetical protein
LRPGGWINLETFALPPLIDDVVKTIEPLAKKNGNLAVEPHEQRQQVHRKGHGDGKHSCEPFASRL